MSLMVEISAIVTVQTVYFQGVKDKKWSHFGEPLKAGGQHVLQLQPPTNGVVLRLHEEARQLLVALLGQLQALQADALGADEQRALALKLLASCGVELRGRMFLVHGL